MPAEREQARAIIVFLKNFEAGRVKTRLAARIGDKQALEVYKTMVARLLSNLKPLADIVVPYLNVLPDRRSEISALSPLLYRQRPRAQKGRDLWERMSNAFAEVFAEGVESALLIGSDIPEIDACLLENYFERLKRFPVVIGPAEDGGYYLIGFRRQAFAQEVFTGIAWSTETVLQQTVEKIRSCGLAYYQGKPLRDIDTVEDLESLSIPL